MGILSLHFCLFFNFRRNCLAFLFLLLSNIVFSQGPDSWTQMTSMPAGMERDRAISFSINGKGYFGLGSDPSGAVFDDLWEYDPIANSWTQKASIVSPYAARNRAFSFVLNGKGYFGCGWDG